MSRINMQGVDGSGCLCHKSKATYCSVPACPLNRINASINSQRQRSTDDPAQAYTDGQHHL